MTRIEDRSYLRENQYRDSTNLEKRSSLHDQFSTNPTGWFAWMAERLRRLPESARILEIGGGPGMLWTSQCGNLPADWHVTLSDFSPGMVAQARARLADAPQDFRFAVLDAQRLPFSSASFDGVIANHMLYHVPDRPSALSEIRRVLRPGGTLFAATNGKTHMRDLYQWVTRITSQTRKEVDAQVWGVELTFNLENGRDQILPYFSSVEMETYPDSLEVTQVGPLIQYVQSMTSTFGQPQILAALEQLEGLWAAEIRSRGAVHISKSSGVFIARAGDQANQDSQASN